MSDPAVRIRKAIINGNYFIVKRLLKRYPDLLDNIDPENGWTNLHYAAFYDRYEIAEIILGQLLVRVRNTKNEVSSSQSPVSKSQGSRKRGSSYGSNTSPFPNNYTQITSEDEIKLDFKRNTVLHAACLGNSSHTLRLLLEYFSVCIDQRGDHGYTPSHICCLKNHSDCLKILLQNGSYPDIVDDDGNTPLHLALQYGFLLCAQSLLSANASDAMVNNQGWSPLDVVYNFETKEKYLTLKKELAKNTAEKEPKLPDHQARASNSNSSVIRPPIDSIPTFRHRKYSLSSSLSSDFEDDNIESSPGSAWKLNNKGSTDALGLTTLRNSSGISFRSEGTGHSSDGYYGSVRRRAPPSVNVSEFTSIKRSPVSSQSDIPSPLGTTSTTTPPAKSSSMTGRNFRSYSLNDDISPTRHSGTSLNDLTQTTTKNSPRYSRRMSSASSKRSWSMYKPLNLANSMSELETSRTGETKTTKREGLNLDTKLGNHTNNNSQESLHSPLSNISDHNRRSRILNIPIASLRGRRPTR